MSKAAVAMGAIAFLVAAALALAAHARAETVVERAIAASALAALGTWTCLGFVQGRTTQAQPEGPSRTKTPSTDAAPGASPGREKART